MVPNTGMLFFRKNGITYDARQHRRKCLHGARDAIHAQTQIQCPAACAFKSHQPESCGRRHNIKALVVWWPSHVFIVLQHGFGRHALVAGVYMHLDHRHGPEQCGMLPWLRTCACDCTRNTWRTVCGAMKMICGRLCLFLMSCARTNVRLGA